MKFFIHLSTIIAFYFFVFYFFSCESKDSELNKKNNELYLKGLEPRKDVNNVFYPEMNTLK